VEVVLAFWYPINLKSHSVQIYSSFEAVCIEISNCSFTGYYHPPGITPFFFVHLPDLLETLVTIQPEFFILGDFNLHLDTATSTFNDILATFD